MDAKHKYIFLARCMYQSAFLNLRTPLPKTGDAYHINFNNATLNVNLVSYTGFEYALNHRYCAQISQIHLQNLPFHSSINKLWQRFSMRSNSEEKIV